MKYTFYKLVVTAVALTGLLMFPSCKKTSLWPERGRGENITENRSAKDFSKISVSISGDVYISESNEFGVSVTAQKNLVDNIVTEVRDNTLYITNTRSFKTKEPVIIMVSLPVLSEIDLAGSANIVGNTPFTTNSLKTKLTGSGNITTDVSCTSFNCEITGSGNIKMSGDCINSKVAVNGSGNYNGYNFETDRTDVSITGSGNAEVNVTESLYATISGSGNVFYTGNGSAKESNITGSGNISKK